MSHRAAPSPTVVPSEADDRASADQASTVGTRTIAAEASAVSTPVSRAPTHGGGPGRSSAPGAADRGRPGRSAPITVIGASVTDAAPASAEHTPGGPGFGPNGRTRARLASTATRSPPHASGGVRR